jgi:uncharacterized protein with HXXEE motif
VPLFWIFGFAVHGITVHIFGTVRQRDYSPGLITSILYWIVAYLAVRYAFGAGLISAVDFWVGAAAGAVVLAGFLSLAPTVIFPALARSPSSRSA